MGQLGFPKLGDTLQPKAESISPETLTTHDPFQRPKAISPQNSWPTIWKRLLHQGPKGLGLPHRSTSAEPTGGFPLSALPILFLHCSHPTPSPTLLFPGPWEWVETAASGGRHQDPWSSCGVRAPGPSTHARTHVHKRPNLSSPAVECVGVTFMNSCTQQARHSLLAPRRRGRAELSTPPTREGEGQLTLASH